MYTTKRLPRTTTRPTTHISRSTADPLKLYRKEYRTLDIPADATTDDWDRINVIFNNAADAFPTYRMPSSTRIVWDTGELVRVCRESAYTPTRQHPPSLCGVHYVGMAGDHGYMPNYTTVDTSRAAVAEALATMHDYAPHGIVYRNLMRNNIHEFHNPQQKAGNQYASITECTCLQPWEHEEQPDTSDIDMWKDWLISEGVVPDDNTSTEESHEKGGN